jgi:potassium efflux system protein
VIELLESVAHGHPEVLENPAPRALFMGYGDSSINFELRVWTESTNWQQVRSDVTVAVYDAVYAAGMTFPFPQREVRLLGDSNKASTMTLGKDSKKP